MRAVLAVFLLLGLGYSLASPIFETPDEAQHFFVVRELVEQHGLPVQRPGEPSRWLQEGSQPPLYYLIGAVLTGWVDASDWQEFSARNPFAVQGDPLTPGNRNVYLHRAPEQFPWRGTVLAVHLLRLVSLAFGAASLLLTYAIALLVFPGRKGLAFAAAAIHAFIPQFLFISAAVSNDALATLACGAVLWQSLRVARGASSRRAHLLLGLLVGLAALSKLSGAAFALVAVAGVVLAWVNMPGARRHVGRLLSRLAMVTFAAALLSGWWYVRNLLAYGDPTGLNRMLAIVGTRNPAPDFWQVLDELEGLRLSFWGIFGWFSILMPAPFYWLFDALAIAALVGLTVRLALAVLRQASAPPRRMAFSSVWQAFCQPLLLPLLAAVIVFIGVVRWGILTPGLQGRLLFPAMPAIALFLSAGLDTWRELLKHPALAAPRRLVVLYPFPFLAIAAAVPFVSILPAYARPELTTPDAAAPMVRWTGVARIDLLGTESPAAAVHPGDPLPLTFRWLTREPIGTDLSLFIKVFGENDELLASADTYPGFGMFPTSAWPANHVVVDRYTLRISPAAHAPVYGEVVVGFYDRATGRSLLPGDAAGTHVVRPVVAHARILPASAQAAVPSHALNANFGDEISLRGYDFDASAITLHWQALAKPSADYTVFVQALDASGAVLAQADGRPRHGSYPTPLWDIGEQVPDIHTLVWPARTVRVAVGLYVLATGARLPLVGQVGDAVLIDLPR